ncbi:MAG: hypothetical protein A2297_04205 [Elusimicrobia bacterium RIFOXYB2_FULL_48_7]|nr:MAG: hypothetical protein A2297_04205 [Elusimicrobia bacterium RIFOXYB2_FULL_48_7]
MKNRKVVLKKPFEVELITEEFDVNNLKPMDVAIKTKYSLISAGTELACYTGNAPWFSLPGTPGYCNMGEVIAVGKDVKDFKKGDLVYSSNGHMEYHVYDSSNLNDILVKTPAGLKLDEGCFGRMGAISFTGLRVSRIDLGDFVGVAGLGIIGNFAAQLAQMQGGTVIAMDINEKRIEIAKQCGIKHVVNMQDKDAMKKKVMEITGGAGVSTFIEATGMSEVIPPILPIVAQYGEIILLGTPRAEFQGDLTAIFKSVHNGGTSHKFIGAHARTIPFQPDPFMKHSHIKNLKNTFELLKENRLVVKPMLTHTMRPEDAKKAYEGLKNSKDEYIAVIYDWTK